MESRREIRWRRVFLAQGVIQILVGIGAVVSGAMLIAAPSGRLLQAPIGMLRNTPFPDFLIPGIILFVVNGVGQLGAAVLSLRRHPQAGLVGAIFGLGLMIWIFVQVNLIGGGHILQYSYFAVGSLETALAVLMHGCLKEWKARTEPEKSRAAPHPMTR